MAVLYIPIGIPSIGKTTYGKKLQEGTPLVVIEKRAITEEMFGKDAEITPYMDSVITEEMDKRTKEFLQEGKDVYYDTFNIGRGRRKWLIKAMRPYAEEISAVLFPVDTEKAVRQNRMREHPVSSFVINRMAYCLDTPVFGEGYDSIILVNSSGKEEKNESE